EVHQEHDHGGEGARDRGDQDVAVVDVAEFVADDAAQLTLVEQAQDAFRAAHGGAAGVAAGGEGVGRLGGRDVQPGHGLAGVGGRVASPGAMVDRPCAAMLVAWWARMDRRASCSLFQDAQGIVAEAVTTVTNEAVPAKPVAMKVMRPESVARRAGVPSSLAL